MGLNNEHSNNNGVSLSQRASIAWMYITIVLVLIYFCSEAGLLFHFAHNLLSSSWSVLRMATHLVLVQISYKECLVYL